MSVVKSSQAIRQKLNGSTSTSTDDEKSKLEAEAEDGFRRKRIRVKNRRKTYLDRHPSYFSSPELELADPLLYDRCIRRFQSAAERASDKRQKGYSFVLEADMARSSAVAAERHDNPGGSRPFPFPATSTARDAQHQHGGDDNDDNDDDALAAVFQSATSALSHSSIQRGNSSEVACNIDNDTGRYNDLDLEDAPQTREQGTAMWESAMTARFIRGDDDDFEYSNVDGGGEDGPLDELDELEVREEQERWFEEESPAWVGDEEGMSGDKDGGDGHEGETGIQDF